MNTLSKFALIVAFSLSNYTFAHNEEFTTENPTSIAAEISGMLNKEALNLDRGSSFQISFVVNKKNQIVVTDIESDDSNLIGYIKKQLNYKQLKTTAKHNQRYFLPITFKITEK